MKKILGILLVMTLLVAGFVVQARADFAAADMDLIRVVYNTPATTGQPQPGVSGYEVITDLGSISSLLASVAGSGSVTVGGGQNAFTNFQGFGSTTSFANLMVTYYAGNFIAGPNMAYISGSQQLASIGNMGGTFGNAYVPLAAIQGGAPYLQGSTNTGVISQTDPNVNSFAQNVEGTTPGTYNGFLTNTTNALATESRLTALGSGGTVSQNLYYFSNGNVAQSGALVTSNGALQIITESNGSTELEGGAVVPVPPSILLLAPGLLGLFGIRRRMA